MLTRKGRELFDETQRVMKFYGSVALRHSIPELHAGASSSATSRAATVRRISRRSASRRQPRRFRGAPIPRTSTGSRNSFSRMRPHTSGGDRPSAGRTITSSGSAKGFAQYFAAMYAEHVKKDGVFRTVIAQMARWTIDRIRSGPGLSRLPPRPHPQRRPRVSRARLQQGRADAAHAAQVDRRRRVLPRAAPFLLDVAIQEGGHRRREGRVRARGEPRSRRLLRSVDLRVVAATHEVQLHDRARRGGRAHSSRSASVSSCRSR